MSKKKDKTEFLSEKKKDELCSKAGQLDYALNLARDSVKRITRARNLDKGTVNLAALIQNAYIKGEEKGETKAYSNMENALDLLKKVIEYLKLGNSTLEAINLAVDDEKYTE